MAVRGRDRVSQGRAEIRFRDNGTVEHAWIHLRSGEDRSITLEIHPVTGQVRCMKEPWKSRPCEAGFTLIELVVAMGLLAVALTAVYQLQGRNLDLHDEARFVTRATQLARARLADVAARSSLTEGEESGSFEEDDGVPSAFGWERPSRRL